VEKVNFKDFELPDSILKAIEEMGFEEPSPIQAISIPEILKGSDIIGQAQTGTGKTAAFGMPLLTKIDPKIKKVQSIILAPTRELAIQIAAELQKISKYIPNIKIVPIYGGQSIDRQIKLLREGTQVVIGTPGRLLDHLQRKTLRLDSVSMVVLDEADEMLDMGFIEDIETILSNTPKDRQTVMFSATMPRQIIDITKKYQNNPQLLKVTHKELSVPLIEQLYYELDRSRAKLDVTTRIIDLYNPKLTLIFCNTKRMVDELVSHLQSRGYFADGLHGDMNQNQRNAVMEKFKKEIVDVLVATDVAARGLDIDNVEAVINYDIPQDEEYYVHRIGRTGRAGRSGRAFTFSIGREIQKIREIEYFTKTRMKRLPIPSINDVEEYKMTQFMETIRKTIEEGHLAKQKNIIEKLLEEDLSTLDVAAALLKLNMGEKKNTNTFIPSEKKITIDTYPKDNYSREKFRKDNYPKDHFSRRSRKTS